MKVYANLYRMGVHLGLWGLYYVLIYQYYILWVKQQDFVAPSFAVHIYTFLHIYLMAIPVYLNYFYLFPRFFVRKCYVFYGLTLVGILALSCILLVELDVQIIPIYVEGFRTLGHYLTYLPHILIFLILFSWGRLIDGWYEKNRQLDRMRKAQLDAELKWLKAQIHPHFFFNALNNIRALVRFKSDDAEEMLLKLSDLMRFVIDHHEHHQIKLKDEVHHIQNYIDLACLKSRWKSKICFEHSGPLGEVQIEPLILTNFVENAFKHGNLDTAESFVSIQLRAAKNALKFTVENSTDNMQAASPVSGIGMENVKKRLELVYPDRYQLIIDPMEDRYKVELTIQLSSKS